MKKPLASVRPGRTPQFYGLARFQLAGSRRSSFIPWRHNRGAACNMATFNRIFTTERLLQIIVVLGAILIMKLLS